MRRSIASLASAVASLCLVLAACDPVPGPIAEAARDPLPSWREGPTKQTLLDFVARVTDEGGADYVPPRERVAVFDNDGTLWPEQPMYTQLAFAVDRVAQLAPEHPSWERQEPFAGILDGDTGAALAGGERAAVELVLATHTGMSAQRFGELVERWLAQAHHPRFGRPYTELAYAPMLELMAYLRAEGFSVFIVTGGGADFVRVFSESLYGVPRAHVVGSRPKSRLVETRGRLVVERLGEVDLVDDGPGKPVGVVQQIGRRPIAAFGNSDGDLELLRWTTEGAGPRLGLLVHHTDDEREYAYDRGATMGALDRALSAAPERGWLIADMARDWARVFAFEPLAP